MASSSKKTSRSKKDANLPGEAKVTDAVIIEETAPVEDVDAQAVEPDVADEAKDITDAVDDGAETSETAPNETAPDETAPDETAEFETAANVPEIAPAPIVQQPAKRSGGFWPLLFGGAIAAGLGFIAAMAYFPNNDVLQSQVAQQASTIDELNAEVASLTASTESLTGDVAAQSEEISRLDAQLADVIEEMNAPVELPSEAELSADLRALLAAQKDEIASLQGDLQSMAMFAEGQIETAQQEAEAAERAEARAKARDGLNKVRLALASGAPFGDALSEIAGAEDVPAALSDVSDGVPTQTELQDSFGASARSALAASNRELSGDGAGDRARLFFQDMIGARSLTPQEGDSPDAVLSRAEAAVRNGDLSGALGEIDALPEGGRTELTEWSGNTKARNDALQAFSDLTDALSAD